MLSGFGMVSILYWHEVISNSCFRNVLYCLTLKHPATKLLFLRIFPVAERTMLGMTYSKQLTGTRLSCVTFQKLFSFVTWTWKWRKNDFFDSFIFITFHATSFTHSTTWCTWNETIEDSKLLGFGIKHSSKERAHFHWLFLINWLKIFFYF